MGTPRQPIPALTAARATGARATSAGSEFLTGLGFFGRGFGLLARSPGLWLFGLIPGVIAGAIVVSALIAMVIYINEITATVTWFADDWSPDSRSAIRIVASVAVIGGSLLLAALTFTALTLTIGDPFYEAISKRVDDRLGGVQIVELPRGRTALRNLVDSLRLLAFSVLVSAVMFGAALIPVFGQTAVPVLDALLGGWLLAVEISGIPFNRRGLRLRHRRQMLRANRALALGFGIPMFLVFLVPLAAIVVMPAAVAGATLMTRRVLNQPQ